MCSSTCEYRPPPYNNHLCIMVTVLAGHLSITARLQIQTTSLQQPLFPVSRASTVDRSHSISMCMGVYGHVCLNGCTYVGGVCISSRLVILHPLPTTVEVPPRRPASTDLVGIEENVDFPITISPPMLPPKSPTMLREMAELPPEEVIREGPPNLPPRETHVVLNQITTMSPEVRELCALVTPHPGGEGVVRSCYPSPP